MEQGVRAELYYTGTVLSKLRPALSRFWLNEPQRKKENLNQTEQTECLLILDAGAVGPI